ncbi:MAG: hypothetical protein ACO20H_13130 [Bacteriovoracaceae bacterium]
MELLKGLKINEKKYELYQDEVEEFVKKFLLKYPNFNMGQKALEDQLAREFKETFPELIRQ